MEAYLDIETTSLEPASGIITIIGIYLAGGTEEKFVQLVDEEITGDNLLKALEGVGTIYTYNGTEFDFPFIRKYTGVNLEKHFTHRDLKYDCWNRNLYGGLKKVEEILGISRKTTGISGKTAVELWKRYKEDSDMCALNILLEYNREDVMSLKTLKEKFENRDTSRFS